MAAGGGPSELTDVFDVPGRRVRLEVAPPYGPLRLGVGGLAPGAYVVRRGGAAAAVTVR